MKTRNIEKLAKNITNENYSEPIENVNNHAFILGVSSNYDFGWHIHTNSDEILLVTEGILEVELPEGKIYHLTSGQLIFIPLGLPHRTSCKDKTVNICFEKQHTTTIFLTKKEDRIGDISNVKIFDVNEVSDGITESHKKMDIVKINNHKIVLAINQGSYFWHNHPNSDELVFIWEGVFDLNFEDASKITLMDKDFLKIHKGMNHFPVVPQRTISLFFELIDTKTVKK